MAEISYEDAVNGTGVTAPVFPQELSYEEVAGEPKKKVPLRGEQEMSYEQAQMKENATFGTAVMGGLTEGIRQGVGGAMEAAGDIFAPEDVSYGDAFKASQAEGPSLFGAVKSAADVTRGKILRGLGTEEFGKNLQGAGAMLGDEARQDLAAKTPEDLNMLQQAGVSAVTSAAQMVPWVAAARLGVASPAMVTGGALSQFAGQSFGQTYNEAKANGAAPEDALSAAMVSGGAEAAGEMLGLGSLLKMGSGWFKKFLMQEIGGEEFTTVVQSLVEKGKYNPEKWSSPDEVAYDLALTALASAGGAGMVGGANKAFDKISQLRTEQSFENLEARRELDQIVAKAEAGILATDAETPALPDSELTPEETVMAELQRAQVVEGLKVEPTPEGAEFGAQIDRLVGKNQEMGRTVPDEPVDLDEGGVTEFVLEGRKARYSPNLLPPSERPIRFSSDENVVGLTLAQAGELPQGSVVAIGGTEEIFPSEVYSRVTQDLASWTAKYMPEARIVLNLEQFAPEHQESAFGLHQMSLTKGGMLHVITPRDLPGFKYQGGDSKTSVAMLTALSHEFGHALKMQTLHQGISAKSGGAISLKVLDELQTGAVSPGTLEVLRLNSPEEADLLETWGMLREKALSGKMTATEFVNKWAGIRKLGSDNFKTVDANKSLYTWAKDRLAPLGKSVERSTAMELILAPYAGETDSPAAQAFLQDYLSLDEYMAEQFSRAAYRAGDIEGGATGGLFSNALAKLRQLFRDLKKQRTIAPGVTFQVWLDAQTLRAKTSGKTPGKFKLSAGVKAARKEAVKRAKATLSAEQQKLLAKIVEEEEPTPPPEQVPVPKDILATAEPTKEALEAMADEMEATGAFYGDKRGEQIALKILRGKIARGQYLEARVQIENALGDIVKWDRENAKGVRQEHSEIQQADLAGLAPEEFRKPEIVAQAADMWKRLGFESPFWKRWGGDTKVLDERGLPKVVWRGSGGHITFLDPTTRGMSTGVSSARRAFWFTDNQENAGWYAQQAILGRRRQLVPEARRAAQLVRIRLQQAQELFLQLPKDSRELRIVDQRVQRLQRQIWAIEDKEENQVLTQPVVQSFFLNMTNPLVVDMEGAPYDNGTYTKYLEQAELAGNDGVIFKNTADPMRGTMYATFGPEQAKLETNVGTFDATDELHWDTDSVGQVGAKETSKLMQMFWDRGKLKVNNTIAKGVDWLAQLQQVAAGQPEDVPLQLFMKLNQYAMKMKNNLQVRAEELVKDMRNESPERIRDLHRLLQAEEKSGALASTLVGKDIEGNVVWGDMAPVDYEARKLVHDWEVQDGPRLRELLNSQGIDPTSEQGKTVLDLYVRTRNTILHQFKGLEVALHAKAENLYYDAPAVLKQEKWKIDGLLSKFRASPFLPKGHFGNYVILVQEDQGPQPRGKRRWQTVRKEHYESKEEWQLKLKEYQAKRKAGEKFQVKSLELDAMLALPMQLPNDFLDSVASTGIYTDEQIETLADLMVKGKYEKIDARYDKIGEKTAGGNDDFMRVFASFSLNNANYIWKMYYRTAFNGAISQTRSQIRNLEKESGLDPVVQSQMLERQRRNLRLMQGSLEYMMHPPQELQAARFWITMAYLAFNVKTAAMNASTQMNTWAAVTTEYGEGSGMKAWGTALKDTASLFWMEKRLKEAGPKEQVRLNEVRSVVDKATRDGVLDQSFAYFLAGQANSSGGMLALHNSWIGRAGHVAMEMGMWPFKTVEKANRVVSLLSFYHAERGAGSNMQKAYEVAVQKTNLLQNDYGAANKSALFRGKKGILTMFASYSVMIGYIMTGGYERGARAQARAQGRAVPSAWHGTTMKLWLMYLILGGLSGVPFAQNVLDLAQFIWRRLFGNTENIELELRKFIQDYVGDPNVAMNGLMHNAAGFDLSGSFGLGRLIPGTDALNKDYRSVGESLGNLGMSFAGPAGGFYKQVSQAVGALVDGNFTEGFKNLPGVLGSLGKATEATLLQEQRPTYGVTTKSGVRLTFDKSTGKFRDLTTGELVGMALGANPTILAENREVNYAIQGEAIYWNTRRGDLLDKYWKAVRTGDNTARAEVTKMITEYNDKVPESSLRITGKDRATSVKIRRRAAKLAETFGTANKRERGLANEMRGSFER